MSQEKFTKGNWEVMPATRMGHNEVISHIVRMESNKRNKYSAIPYACIGGFPDEKAKEEIEANTHLIAAAPQMYRMLETLMNRYPNSPHIQDPIIKLLAKARGENEP